MNRPHRFGIGRLLLRSTLCTALFFASPGHAQEPSWQLAMKDAELRDVVQHMSSVLGATVVLDPRVQGRITVISDQPLDREGVRNLFYSVLEAQGFAVVDQGERLLIIPAADAKTRASTAGTRPALDEEFVTEIIELNTSLAADLSGLLRPLVSNNGYVGPSTSANALVVSHGGVTPLILAELLQIPVGEAVSRIKQGNDEIYLVRLRAKSAAQVWKLLGKDSLEQL